jgi:hypothetical protein
LDGMQLSSWYNENIEFWHLFDNSIKVREAVTMGMGAARSGHQEEVEVVSLDLWLRLHQVVEPYRKTFHPRITS